MADYNIFGQDKRKNYPSYSENSQGLSPEQVNSMTYTMDELNNGKGVNNILPNTQNPSITTDVGHDSAGAYVGSKVKTNYPGGTGVGDGMGYLQGLYTSPEQEERLRKASVNKQRIMALGDALRHIGNIYHTTRYAPSQQFNTPYVDERNRYLQEKVVRDANNYKYMVQKQNEDKLKAEQAQREFENELKVANYDLNKQKADAYQKTQEAQRGYNEARTKNEGLRGEGIEADNRLKNYKADVAPQEFELKRRDTESRIASRKDASERGWANFYRLSNNSSSSSSKSRVGVSKDGARDLYVSPDGSAYSFPKGKIDSKNINTIYGNMVRMGYIDNDYDVTSDGEKWDAIMKAAGSSKKGHDTFIYYAKRLDYKYEGGMRPEVSQKYWGGEQAKSDTQPKAQPKQKTQPKSTVNAGTKPSAPKAGTGSKSKKNSEGSNNSGFFNK